jgi:hypothetical protein
MATEGMVRSLGLCAPVTRRAAHVCVGFFKETFSGLVRNEYVANSSGSAVEELGHGF